MNRRRPTGRISTVVLGALALALVLSAPARAAEVFDLMPAEVQGAVVVTSLERLFDVFDIAAIRAENPGAFSEFSADLLEQTGYDPADLDGWRRAGFDVGRPFAFGMAGKEDLTYTVLLLPGGREALDTLRRIMVAEGEERVTEHRGVEIRTVEDVAAVLAHKDYVAVVAADEGSAVSAAEHYLDQLDRRRLTADDRYRRVAGGLDRKADVGAYVGPELYRAVFSHGEPDELAAFGMSVEETEALYKEWGLDDASGVFSATFTATGVSGRGAGWIRPDSPLFEWYRLDADPTAFLRRTPADPWLANLGRINLGRAWRVLREAIPEPPADSLPSLDERLEQMSETLKIDVERELIEQIDGNVLVLINRAAPMEADAALLVQVSDPARFRQTLAHIVAESSDGEEGEPSSIVEDQVAGVSYYRSLLPVVGELCMGVIDDHFVLTLSRERFRAIAEGERGFAATLGNKSLQSAADDPTGTAFYLDFQGMLRDLEALAPMLGGDDEMLALARELSHLVVVSRIGDGKTSSEFELVATNAGFWRRLLERFAVEEEPESY
ncbi:MAG: DUF3352 domain-containing protein [Candidatus Krumholzibacteria bacterium]|nr:DUF3352 domain-containing protein [Candidatus Krumholzibacteria bacterium]